MFKSARKASTLLLTALLAICWIVGEAWHLAPGMAHLEQYEGGCLVIGAAPCKIAEPPCDCGAENVRQQSPCPLEVLSVNQCPICRTLSQHQAVSCAQAAKPLPELIHAGPVDQPTCYISAHARKPDARGPPA